MGFLSESYKRRLLKLSGVKIELKENVEGKHLVVVDIQPEYEDGFSSWLPDFVQYLNENYESLSNLTFFYNGADTLGMISESEYKSWWYENGLDEEIVYDAHFYDKGYAFFRYCMDEHGHDETVALVKHMLDNDVHDSRELGEEFWNSFTEKYGYDDLRELMEFSDDAIHIPELIEEIQRYSNIVLCGGGINECLKEVEIALEAIDKPYTTLSRFVY